LGLLSFFGVILVELSTSIRKYKEQSTAIEKRRKEKRREASKILIDKPPLAGVACGSREW